MRPELLSKTIIILVLIWAVVFFGARSLGQKIITPESITARIEAGIFSNVAEGDVEGRRLAIRSLVEDVSRLDFNQRGEMQGWSGDGALRRFSESLSGSEKAYLVSLAIEQEFGGIMEAFSAMPEDQRRKMMGRVRKAIGGDDNNPGTKVEADVFKSFVEGEAGDLFEGAGDGERIDLAPILEELQGRMKGMRR